jgi:phage recombination protein Bet
MPESAMTVVPSIGESAQVARMPHVPAQLQVSREWENQLELVKRTVAPGLTDEEFALFCHVARVRHLDPLQRQIHAVKRATWDPEKNGYVEKMTIQTGIDGYRSIANRTELYMPSDRLPLAEDLGKENLRVTVWVKKFSTNDSAWHEFGATAYYREYVQTRKNKVTSKVEPNAMWEKMPINQLTKCAEALALRRGWPEELGQIYVDEELPSQEPVYLPPEPPKQSKTQRELGSLKVSAEPNRGHGNEGTQRRPEPEICAECRQTNGHSEECKQNPKNAKEPVKEQKKSKREIWATQPGHDPAVHIPFDEGIQLFDLQRKLGITDEQIREFLDREFEIEHRYLIRQDQFQQVLDAVRKTFDVTPVTPKSGVHGQEKAL